MTNKQRLDDIENMFCEFSSLKNYTVDRDKFKWLLDRVKTLTTALEFYAIRARYEWSSNGGLLGESLISDSGSIARKALTEDES